MECRRLYYEDPMCKEFTAQVTGCEKHPKGYAITLDATAFYPEGGGQAADTGTLGSVQVLDTREEGEHLIHICDGALKPGQTVTGRIHWDARFDRMQQHTGEHILSGLIHKTFGWHNVGFHMGSGVMEVDFDGPISQEALEELEAKVNAIVWENRPVVCSVPDPEALASLTYRTKRALPWPVRIVEIPEADVCACCGTHVPTTGMVGLVKVLSVTKFHQGVRLEMVCGRRALEYLTSVHRQNRQIGQQLSVKPMETAQAVQKLADALTQERLRANALQSRILEQVAQSYAPREQIVHFEPGLDGDQLRTLAQCLLEKAKVRAAVFTPREQGFGYCVASHDPELKTFGKEMNTALGGRGGGKPPFWQGTLTADREAVLRWFGENDTNK